MTSMVQVLQDAVSITYRTIANCKKCSIRCGAIITKKIRKVSLSPVSVYKIKKGRNKRADRKPHFDRLYERADGKPHIDRLYERADGKPHFDRLYERADGKPHFDCYTIVRTCRWKTRFFAKKFGFFAF
jgi:hypothetical protein